MPIRVSIRVTRCPLGRFRHLLQFAQLLRLLRLDCEAKFLLLVYIFGCKLVEGQVISPRRDSDSAITPWFAAKVFGTAAFDYVEYCSVFPSPTTAVP